VCCGVLQCVAVCGSVNNQQEDSEISEQSVCMCCSVLLQCVVLSCSELQCVAVGVIRRMIAKSVSIPLCVCWCVAVCVCWCVAVCVCWCVAVSCSDFQYVALWCSIYCTFHKTKTRTNVYFSSSPSLSFSVSLYLARSLALSLFLPLARSRSFSLSFCLSLSILPFFF